MPARKLAISLPEDVLKQVDRIAKLRHMSRSGFIADVLRTVAGARSDADIRARIDRLFRDPEVASEQKETVDAFLSVGAKKGTEW